MFGEYSETFQNLMHAVQHHLRQLPPIQFQLVPFGSVDNIDTEVALPVPVPLRLVEALDGEDDGSDVGGDAVDEVVVLLGVLVLGREQLDNRPEGAVHGQDLPPWAARLQLRELWEEAVGIVTFEDFTDHCHVLLKVSDVNRAVDYGVIQALRDLALAAAADGGRLVAVGSLAGCTDQLVRLRNGEEEQVELVSKVLNDVLMLQCVLPYQSMQHASRVGSCTHLGARTHGQVGCGCFASRHPWSRLLPGHLARLPCLQEGCECSCTFCPWRSPLGEPSRYPRGGRWLRRSCGWYRRSPSQDRSVCQESTT